MRTELAVVGAGPAGMAAAAAAAHFGIDVTVIDEQPRAGGQFLRQPPAGFRIDDWLPGRTYRDGKALLERASARPGIDWLFRTGVSGVLAAEAQDGAPAFMLMLDGAGGVRTLAADRVVLASGCYDMPVIFAGWNLPGVMAAGGIQAFVKSQQLVAGQRFVLAGSHPLQLIVADQLVQAGADVAGVHFAQRASRALALLRAPGVVFGNAGKFADAALAWRRLRAAGVPVRFGETVIAAIGGEAVNAVRIAPVDASGALRRDETREIACDRLGVCFGFLASSELARQLGAACAWDAPRGGWIVEHDRWMQTTVPGLFAAGEITGVAGAGVAAGKGFLAALGSALAAGRITAAVADRAAKPIRRRLLRLDRFAAVLAAQAWPGTRLLEQMQHDDANLCKCEEVTVGVFVNLMHEHAHVATASAAKLLSRAGMGYCQGRYCQASVIRILAAQRGVPEAQLGGFTSRFPAKPVLIGDLLRRLE